MVKITSNSLIIEIPTKNELPLEKLGRIQEGLINLIGIIDHNEPKAEIQEGLWHLRGILKELSLSPEQLLTINECIVQNKEVLEAFK
jgi:hypothetical protein